MGGPGRPGFAGVVCRVAERQLFCRKAAFWPKSGRSRVSAFRRRTGGPLHEPTRQRPRHRDGLSQAARICGGRLPRCRATAVLPPSRVTPKCGWTRVSALRRRTGGPLAPPRCAPSLGAPSRALAARAALGVADSVPCARPSAAACASLDLMDVARAAAPGARRTRRRPDTRRRARAKPPARRGAWAPKRVPAAHVRRARRAAGVHPHSARQPRQPGVACESPRAPERMHVCTYADDGYACEPSPQPPDGRPSAPPRSHGAPWTKWCKGGVATKSPA